MLSSRLLLAALVAAASPTPVASPPPAVESPPTLRLPSDVRPTAEELTLTIDPTHEGFSGSAGIDIELSRPRQTIWLHGKGLRVSRATAQVAGGPRISARWKQESASGLASLTLDAPLPAGRARLEVDFEAPFGPKLEGLYRITVDGAAYAFTQFESTAARDAFPCFDEPGFKIPWDTTLFVRAGDVAVANTRELQSHTAEGMRRVHFAPTPPLPSYLVAFAVGPLDVVPAPDIPPNSVRPKPVPLRAVTTRGHGNETAYALKHAGELLATLEQLLGFPYPYDKLDLLAVSDKGGAMENAGALMFADRLLLLDEKGSSLEQRRAFASVMAHELAHQWVGDWVTARFWDDLWLNEAFATWLGTRAVDQWDPKSDAATSLLRSVQYAIGQDSLVSARAVRQPILSPDDIENAFDGITYSKGAGVLSMFERWVGADVFRQGLHDYLAQHAGGTASADDFLDAESAVAHRDLKTPFHTFLDQPGVPLVEAELRCSPSPHLHLRQSRYLPIGSRGDARQRWQVPVCVRYAAAGASHEACTLLDREEGDLALGSACPTWVFPNAAASGYYRFLLSARDLEALEREGLPALDAHERVAFGNSLRAAFNRAALPLATVLTAAAPLARDPHVEVAREPMSIVETARDWLYADPVRPQIELYGQQLFHPVYAPLGWASALGDSGERIQLRQGVIQFLAHIGRDHEVRAEGHRLGRAYLGEGGDGKLHPEAVDPNLAGLAASIAGEDAEPVLWERVRALLATTTDSEVRRRLLGFLVAERKPELTESVHALAFDPALRSTEVVMLVYLLMADPATRESTWAWIQRDFDRLLAAVPKHHGQTPLIEAEEAFCDEAHARQVEAFFTPARLALIEGGPRVLAATLESIRLCTAKRQAMEAGAREAFHRGTLPTVWGQGFDPFPGARRLCTYRSYDDVQMAIRKDPPADAAHTDTTYYAVREPEAAVRAFYRARGAAEGGTGPLLTSGDGQSTLSLVPAREVRETCGSDGSPKAGEQAFAAVSEHLR